MKKTVSIFLMMMVIPCALQANENKKVYSSLLANKKFDELETHLAEWMGSSPEDPEVYIAYFNYYVNLDSDTVNSFQRELDTGRYIVGPKTHFNEINVLSGISYLDQALEKFPDRLDIHFGKIRLLLQIQDYANQAEALSHSLDVSIRIGNRWLWEDNEPVIGGKDVFLNSAQDYFNAWFNINTEESLNALYTCAKKEMEIYPEIIFGYSNLSLYYLLKEDYPNAVSILLKAEKIDPEDHIILYNLAECYTSLGNTQKAMEYFEKLLEYPDKIDPAYIQERVDALP